MLSAASPVPFFRGKVPGAHCPWHRRQETRCSSISRPRRRPSLAVPRRSGLRQRSQVFRPFAGGATLSKSRCASRRVAARSIRAVGTINSVMRSRATYFRGRADRIARRSWRRAKSRVDRQIGVALQPAGSVSVIRDVGKLFPDRGSVCVIPIWVSAQDAQIDRNQDRSEAVAGRNLV
jgi:hypothetical protein